MKKQLTKLAIFIYSLLLNLFLLDVLYKVQTGSHIIKDTNLILVNLEYFMMIVTSIFLFIYIIQETKKLFLIAKHDA